MLNFLIFSRRTPVILPLAASFVFALVLGAMPLQVKAIPPVPSVDDSRYLDSDPGLDGTVERIRWTLTDTVTRCDFEAGDWSIDNAGAIGVTAITGLECSGASDHFDILVTTSAGITGGMINPVITYTNQGTANNISTNVQGALPTAADVSAADAAAPVIKQADYRDDDGDGKIDQFRLWFSEPVSAASILRDADLVLSNDGDFDSAAFANLFVDKIAADSTESVILTLGTESTLQDTNNEGTLQITSRDEFSLTDGTNVNNVLQPQNQIVYVDNAAPVFVSALYYDNNPRDGKVDSIMFGTSETLDFFTSHVSNNDLVFANVGDFTGMAFGPGAENEVEATTSFTVWLGTPAAVMDTHEDSGLLSISTQNDFVLSDGVNFNRGLGVQTQIGNYGDSTPPAWKSVTYYDTDRDGKIDALEFHFSEVITASSTISPYSLFFTDTGDFTGAEFGPVTTDLVTADTDTVYVELGTEATAVDTREDSGELSISFLTGISYYVEDLNSGFQSYKGIGELIDAADVVVVSTNPGDGGTLRPLDGTFQVTFSEEMDPTTLDSFFGDPPDIWVNPDPGGLTSNALSMDGAGRTVLSVSHDAFDLDQIVDVTVYGRAVQALDGSTIPDNYEFSFIAKNRSGGGGSVSSTTTSTTPTIDLTDPTASESLTAGEAVNVAWTHGGSGISQVELRYSTDGGVTTTLIASNLSTTSPYSWTVPSTLSGSVKLILIGQDSGKSNLATDEVSVTVSAVSTPTEEEQNADQEAADAAAGITTDADGHRVAPGTGTYGSSPFDGSSEEISEVASGWFIRSYNYDTVYYVSDGLARRPFWSATAFMTWAPTGWNDVVWVTDATLATLTLGDVMLPKPGVVLVKISSDPKVYLAEYGETSADPYLLRWVSTETVASTMFGAAWADYIIDIESTVMGHYDLGSDVTFAETVETSIMRTRMELASMVAGM